MQLKGEAMIGNAMKIARRLALVAGIGSLAVAGCAEMMQQIQQDQLMHGKAAEKAEARAQQPDGYEYVQGFDSFKEAVHDNPAKKMKFCVNPRQGSIQGKHMDQAKVKWPQLFRRNGYYFWIDDRPEFFMIPDSSQATAFNMAADRGPVCVWYDGVKETAGTGQDYANVYLLSKWDGVTPDDEDAARREVETAASQSASSSAPPSGDADKPPADEPSRY